MIWSLLVVSWDLDIFYLSLGRLRSTCSQHHCLSPVPPCSWIWSWSPSSFKPGTSWHLLTEETLIVCKMFNILFLTQETHMYVNPSLGITKLGGCSQEYHPQLSHLHRAVSHGLILTIVNCYLEPYSLFSSPRRILLCRTNVIPYHLSFHQVAWVPMTDVYGAPSCWRCWN